MPVRLTDQLAWAETIAGQCMAPLGRRWDHVRSVAARAAEVSRSLRLDETVLVSAAWLHDIGYVADIAGTGLHALDGARFLRDQGVDERILKLVANHSCALIEAEERGLSKDLLAEFPSEASVMTDALWYCDMVTGPSGELMTLVERLEEVRSRYGSADAVAQWSVRAEPELVEAVDRTRQRLSAAGSDP